MILYHGSNVEINNIELLKSKPFKDFGRGFYLFEDELMVEVENKLLDLESQCKQRYVVKDRNKAKVQTYIAWEHKPGISVATAVNSRVLNPHTPTADKFVEWIKELFVNE